MAFFSKVGGILKQTVGKHVDSGICGSSSSMFQMLRHMSSSKVFVGGLSYGTDDTSLREAFSKYGEVVDARVIMDRESGRSRGFGFITYTTSDDAAAAIQAVDGQELHGRRVTVNYATERSRSGGFGGGGGYGGGSNYGGNYGGGGYNSNNYGGGGYGGNNFSQGGNYASGGGYGGQTGGSYGGGNQGFGGAENTYGGQNYGSGVSGYNSPSNGNYGGGSQGFGVTGDGQYGGDLVGGDGGGQFGSTMNGNVADASENFGQQEPPEANGGDNDYEHEKVANKTE